MFNYRLLSFSVILQCLENVSYTVLFKLNWVMMHDLKTYYKHVRSINIAYKYKMN